jgi:hypothetical protein
MISGETTAMVIDSQATEPTLASRQSTRDIRRLFS